MIRLIISHAPLSSALRTFLTSQGAIVVDDREAAPGDVVITTTADTAPGGCRQLVDTGARVVVLAAHPTEASASRFLLAGAEHYLEMSADTSRLIDAVHALASPAGTLSTIAENA